MLQHNTDVLLTQCIATYQLSITILPLIVSFVPDGTMNFTSIYIYIYKYFEGGGALPEDTSREGCGVGTPETRRGAGR